MNQADQLCTGDIGVGSHPGFGKGDNLLWIPKKQVNKHKDRQGYH